MQCLNLVHSLLVRSPYFNFEKLLICNRLLDASGQEINLDMRNKQVWETYLKLLQQECDKKEVEPNFLSPEEAGECPGSNATFRSPHLWFLSTGLNGSEVELARIGSSSLII